MNAVDWIVLVIYMLGMIGMSIYLGRGQENQEDYYVGGRNLPWWAVGTSTMATQTSANSFLGIPAFVALAEGGGLKWLQYELAVPLAMIFVMVLLIPFFRNLKLVSVYEYLELRFGTGTRLMMSGVFLFSRAFGTGIGVYAIALVLTIVLDWPLWATILLIGIVTVIYDTIGGMAAVVYSDVIQLIVLVGGLLLLIGFALSEVGGVGAALGSVAPERMKGIELGTGIGDGSKFPFWGFLIGGFFLYASYYGVDQSQAQRELSAPTLADTKRSLVFNGLARFPLTVLYLALGIAAAAVFEHSEELRAAVTGLQDPDKLGGGWRNGLIPQMILLQLPTGLRALLIAALLAAAMSSLDSALNSLSAATMKDFITRNKTYPPEMELRLGKITTVAWGVVLIGCALVAKWIPGTVVESVNMVGSAFYGPILAAFLTGILSRRCTGPGVVTGVLAGVGFNIGLFFLDKFFGFAIVWAWWNLTGLLVASGVTYAVSLLTAPPAQEQLRDKTLVESGLLEDERKWLPTYAILAGYFVVILLITVFIDDILT